MLLDLGGVDYLERAPRFDVVYHLLKLPARASNVARGRASRARLRVLCGLDEGEPSADRQRSVAERRLGRARSLRSFRHHVRRPPGSAAHSDAARLGRLSAAQGLSAARARARKNAASRLCAQEQRCRPERRRRAEPRGTAKANRQDARSSDDVASDDAVPIAATIVAQRRQPDVALDGTAASVDARRAASR